MEKKSKLGKGLDAIFGDNLSSVLEEIQHDEKSIKNELNIDEIRPNPYQPRIHFDTEKLEELSQSIKEHGVFTPILVRKAIGGYELIAGERRLRASKLAQRTTIPAIILEMNEDQMMEVSLLENVQREDLNPIEEANGYYNILNNLNYTQEELAKRLGKSRAYIANLLRLRRLPQEVQEMVARQQLSGSHVRTLLMLEDEKQIKAWAQRTIKEQLSVHDLEKLLKQEEKPQTKKEKKRDIFLEEVQRNIEQQLQTKVEVSKHKMVIHYEDTKDLNRILEQLHLLED